MKTQQIMERPFCGSIIRQNHKTGFLNLNDLAQAGDKIRLEAGLPQKHLASYFQTNETKEFLKAISLEEGIPVGELKTVKRGRSGGTYAHPLVFLDVAIWYDQSLKVKISSLSKLE